MQIFVCVRKLLCPAMGSEATKPKHCLNAENGTTKMLQQAARIMKLTALLILGACLHVHAVGFGQKISLSETNVPIETVFKKIEQQTNLKFLYADHVVKTAKNITIRIKDANISEVLNLVFADQVFGYEINESMVFVLPFNNLSNKGKPLSNNPPSDIRGIITDENGSPVQGVNIIVKGTSKGATTNFRGEFLLKNIDANAVLIITYVGYDREELSIGDKKFITKQLKVAVGNLDELQVIGYGKTSKRFNTGNVSSIKANEIEKQPINNPILALQGRVPGVFVNQNSGLPGGGITVRIQGQNSINYGNDPLFIIDGVPFTSQHLPNLAGILGSSGGAIINGVAPGGGNPLSYLNPSDIESIEILKDADATSIYGSRAANGAVLITTKKGQAGKTKGSVNLQHGWGQVANKLELLNTNQYLEMRKEAINNDGLSIVETDYDINGTWDSTRYTDWQDKLIGGIARFENINTTISGGNSTTQFLFGGSYRRETTVFPGDLSDKKISFHFNLNNVSSNRKFRFQLFANYLNGVNRLIGTDLTNQAVLLAPNAPSLYKEDGSLNWAETSTGNSSISTWVNPLSYLYQKYTNKGNNLISNAVLGYKIFQDLELGGSLGYTILEADEVLTSPLLAVAPENRPTTNRLAQYNTNKIVTWIFEPQIRYKRMIGYKGQLESLIGMTIQGTSSIKNQLNGRGFTNDLVLEDLRSAATVTVPNNGTINSKYKYNAIFGRLTYTFVNKYVLNLTGRRDGSSRFGRENQFHNFGSIGAAWIFSNESFIKSNSPFISFGKIKGSFGTTGSDQIGDYQYLNLYRPVSGLAYQNVIGIGVNNLNNPYLQWELTKKFQVGIDLGIAKDRIVITADYFSNNSSNQLLSYSLPIITGAGSITRNFPAKVRNTGWELSIKSVNIKRKDFTWSTSINVTIPKNKLVEFPGISTSSYASSLVIGMPITIRKVFDYVGVDATTGLFQFLDSSGKVTDNPNSLTDQSIIINTSPTFFGGLHNSFRFRGFQLDVLFQFVKQKALNYNFGNYPGNFYFGNQPVNVLNQWQKPGDQADLQKYNTDYSLLGQFFNASLNSDATWKDASYLRLKNISLSWQIPAVWASKLRLENCMLYCQGQNLLTVTDYVGLDPETKNTTSLPPLRIFAIGLQVGF